MAVGPPEPDPWQVVSSGVVRVETEDKKMRIVAPEGQRSRLESQCWPSCLASRSSDIVRVERRRCRRPHSRQLRSRARGLRDQRLHRQG